MINSQMNPSIVESFRITYHKFIMININALLSRVVIKRRSYKPSTREDQAKRLNPSYRPYSKGNPSQVIFRLKVSGFLTII